jgi:hypothetical protein
MVYIGNIRHAVPAVSQHASPKDLPILLAPFDMLSIKSN